MTDIETYWTCWMKWNEVILMKETEIKNIIQMEILNKMNDQGGASVLREVLFNSESKINWENIGLYAIQKHMPELKMF